MNIKNDAHESETAKAAREILAYLADHADAQDTLEGIVQWWLLERNIINRTEAVKQALDMLTQEGLMIQSTDGDFRVHYSLNRERYEAIDKRLKTPSRKTPGSAG